MKILTAILLSISLQGCGLFSKKPELPAITPQVVTIDQYLLEPCPGIDEELDINGFESIQLIHADLLSMYVTCAKKQAGGVVLLKKFGNIK